MVLVVCLGHGIVQVLSPQVEESQKNKVVHVYGSTRPENYGRFIEGSRHSGSFQVIKASFPGRVDMQRTVLPLING